MNVSAIHDAGPIDDPIDGDRSNASTGTDRSCNNLLATLFDQFCDETGPTGLMAGADSGSVVAVKIFIEKNKVAPVRIALKRLSRAGHRPASRRIAEKNAHKPPGNFRSYLPKIG